MSPSETRRRGGPLGFLAMVVLGWAGLRLAAVSLWPGTEQPDASVLQLAALEQAGDGAQVESDIAIAEQLQTDLAAVEPAPDNLVPSSNLVEGLEPAPPAHLEVAPVPLPEAAAHNSLWMAASSLDAKATDVQAEQTGGTNALK